MDRILIAGASGLVGSATLNVALEHGSIAKVAALTRRPLDRSHDKLEEWVSTSKDLLTGLKDEKADAVICCLGTTIKKAGSKKAFRYVDRQLVVGLAHWAKEQGVPVFCVVSAMGADPSSLFFYNRVKGKMERDLERLHLPSLNIFHPSILTGPREETRVGERIGIAVAGLFSPLMIAGMRDYRPMPHDMLAKALVRAALEGRLGTQRFTYDDIKEYAARL